MRKPPKYKGYSFFDYWDKENQKIQLDLENYVYYFEKPANTNQESLIYSEIPYRSDFFLPIINKIIQKAIKIQFKDEDVKKDRLKKSFFSIWHELPTLQPFRFDKLLNIFRKRLLSKKKNELSVGLILISNQIILFHSKSGSIKIAGYWEKKIIDKDPEKYIANILHFNNLLRASIIKFEKKNFFLTIYEHNSELTKTHAKFWGLDVSYVDDVRDKVWVRDKGICQNCNKLVYETVTINPEKELERDLSEIKEIKIYKWKRECWKCHKESPRVTYNIILDYGYCIGDIEKLDRILMENYPFVKKAFSNTRGEEVIANTCIHCGALQGNLFVIHEDFVFLCNEDIDKFIDIIMPNKLTIEDLGINEERLEAYDDEYEEIHTWGHIHHIDGNRHNNELNNLILLCDKCHAKKRKKINES